jgi:uncharacterized membrane protein
MNEFLKMDIFFVVATVAVVLIAVALAFVLLSLYRILRKVEEVAEMVSDEGKELRADIARARVRLAQQGLVAGALTSLVDVFRRPVKRRAKKSSSEPHL